MSFNLKLDRYNVQQKDSWPSGGRHILSQYDDVAIIVYGTVHGQIRNGFYKGREKWITDHFSKDADDINVAASQNGVCIEETADDYSNNKVARALGKCETERDTSANVEGETTESVRCEKETSDLAKLLGDVTVLEKCEQLFHESVDLKGEATLLVKYKNKTDESVEADSSVSSKCENETIVYTKCETGGCKPPVPRRMKKPKKLLSVPVTLEGEATASIKCEKETDFEAVSNVSEKCKTKNNIPTKCESDESLPPVPPRLRIAVSEKHEGEVNRKNDESIQGNNEFVWLQTSFVRKMHSCNWGNGLDHERILAVSIRREGFETILRTYVDDVQNDRELDEVLLEWYLDRSPTGEVLTRCVPNIRISGSILRQFYTKWVLGIKDISGYVERQRRHIQKGNLNSVWTPKETDYIPGSREICNALDITNEETDKAEDFAEPLDIDSFNFTLAEAFSSVNHTEEDFSSNDAREAILYLYGAFNPVHLGHVNALVEAKQWLENTAKYHVCDTQIAIASDINIKDKFQNSRDLCIKFEHRLKLCELACVNHPCIKVSPTPVGSQLKFGLQLRKDLNKPNATLVLLMGSDRAILTNSRVAAIRRENRFILCVGRKGMSSGARKSFEKAKKNDPNRSLQFFVVPTEMNNISSTSIRENLRKLNEGKMKNNQKVANDLKVVKNMIESNWITEEEGEYIFQNCGALYIAK